MFARCSAASARWRGSGSLCAACWYILRAVARSRFASAADAAAKAPPFAGACAGAVQATISRRAATALWHMSEAYAGAPGPSCTRLASFHAMSTPKLGRRHAGHGTERTREVALIGEAGIGGDVTQRKPGADPSLRFVDPQLTDHAADRAAEATAEAPRQMHRVYGDA